MKDIKLYVVLSYSCWDHKNNQFILVKSLIFSAKYAQFSKSILQLSYRLDKWRWNRMFSFWNRIRTRGLGKCPITLCRIRRSKFGWNSKWRDPKIFRGRCISESWRISFLAWSTWLYRGEYLKNPDTDRDRGWFPKFANMLHSLLRQDLNKNSKLRETKFVKARMIMF